MPDSWSSRKISVLMTIDARSEASLDAFLLQSQAVIATMEIG